MPPTDLDRIVDEALAPRVVTLHRALARLRSCVSFMHSGAHPDDEASAMLAALGTRDGLDLSYACATRGEGGQNDVGTEAGADLGTLRTAEMERAADVLGLRLYWLSQAPGDVADFGFSKSGVETLGRWGRERTLRRFVGICRTERPDVLCPTFLDVPGQHGHHRAMTEAAHDVVDLAADPAFETPGLAPWTVKKLYLPAWGGGGGAYDDEVAPPPATLVVRASGVDPVTGWSFERIGQQSRRFHLTQGMGRWVEANAERDWPLHLARSSVPGPDDALVAGLPATLGGLAAWAGAPALEAPLGEAQAAIDEALAHPFDYPEVLAATTRALVAVREARGLCPDAARDEVLHRLARKEAQLSTAIRLAAGVEVRGRLDRAALRPGESAALAIERRDGVARADVGLDVAADGPWSRTPDGLALSADASPSDPYPDAWLPDAPRAPALVIDVEVEGVASRTRVPLETPPTALPARSATLDPAALLLNLASAARELDVRVGDVVPAGATVGLDVPDGWDVERIGEGLRVRAPAAPEPGLHELALTVDGEPAHFETRIEYPHAPPRVRAVPAAVRVRVLEAALPDVRVGYVGGGNDRVAHWLRALGLDVVELDDAALGAERGLGGVDALVVGLFAMRTRPELARAMPRVHRWVEAGGRLVTLYHRPWDGWDPETVPPRRLEIGRPSLRWRVTDENAAVTVLAPEHPLLNAPNRIGEADWAGWHKERGLYFARSWDDAYAPLLSMADPGEAPLEGALLCASIGAGRHVHTSLILHHQMEQLVPGAFRLMANLVA